jgi:hypothetical protein
MNKLLTLLSLDPSTRNLGYACCDLSKAGRDPDIYDTDLWHSGVVHPQGLELPHKIQDAYEQLSALLRKEDLWPTNIVSEWPMFFGTARGKIAASQDHTIGLAGMAAGVASWFRLPATKVTLLTPAQWKGSVPKEVTRRRLEKAFQVDTENLGDDEIDAIGIAEYWLKNHLRSLRGPPLNERHGQGESDLIRLVTEAIPNPTEVIKHGVGGYQPFSGAVRISHVDSLARYCETSSISAPNKSKPSSVTHKTEAGGGASASGPINL